MRKTTTAVLAVTAAIPLAFAVATPAAAAPGDVTAEFTTSVNPRGGNSVTGTFTSTPGTRYPGYCSFSDQNAAGQDPDVPLELAGSAGPTSGPYISGTDVYVANGTYTVDWICYTVNFDLIEATTGYGGTTTPTTITLPGSVVVPEVPGSDCSGSVCLPTGSFGF